MCVKNEALLKKVRVWRSWQRNPGTPLPKLPLSAPPGPKILTQHLIHFCSSEYGNETACLNNHVNTCVKDEPFLNPLRGEISKLLVLLVYHCGNVNSNNVEGVNQLILTTVQCNRGALNSIVNCWDDFRSAFEANKSDTSLCRWGDFHLTIHGVFFGVAETIVGSLGRCVFCNVQFLLNLLYYVFWGLHSVRNHCPPTPPLSQHQHLRLT